jgi:hypothetical protein
MAAAFRFVRLRLAWLLALRWCSTEVIWDAALQGIHQVDNAAPSQQSALQLLFCAKLKPLVRKVVARSAETICITTGEILYAHRMRQLPKLRLCPKHHALIFVRLPHDRRFVGAVFFLFFVLVLLLVLFVFIGISGRHRVAHDHEGTPIAGFAGAHFAAPALHEHRFGWLGHSLVGLIAGALGGSSFRP